MRNRSFVILVLFLISALFIVACPGRQLDIGAETPKQIYLKAHMTYNALLSDYIVDKRAAPPDLQKKWTAQIDPYFERANMALRVWGLAVMNETGTSINQQMAYMDLKNQLLDLLLAELTDYD